MPLYNKLVRDLIPDVIDRAGKTYSTRILEDEEYILELKKKSFEELEEYMKTTNTEEAMEELADLLEIIHALAECHDTSFKEIEVIRKQKAITKGAFKNKVFLIDVED
ncbi:phosphoribosyl-ATP pyrophosphohydrolase [Bacillus sp. DJP31]|uniref:phosphoribosyl-ATP pyrophosphohydrolase n=1 Tax=Bacillus sp. DJP31 TaxID=3409789 RepID=UPI003BB77964